MRDKNKGLYKKFTVNRNDGKDAVGDKHHDCAYFVLDITHDEHAIPALEAYAESCKVEYPELANDLMKIVCESRRQVSECFGGPQNR